MPGVLPMQNPMKEPRLGFQARHPPNLAAYCKHTSAH